MKTTRLAVSLLFALAANAAAQSTPDLAGLWGATLRFGPDTRGLDLVISLHQRQLQRSRAVHGAACVCAAVCLTGGEVGSCFQCDAPVFRARRRRVYVT
jgi:hypothetical protein